MPLARDEAGHVWEVDAQGNPVRLHQAAQQAPQMPTNPAFPYQGAQAQAQAQNTGAQAQVNTATIPAQISKAGADATAAQRAAQTAGLGEGMMWGPDGKTAVPIPGYARQGLSPEVRQKAIAQWESAQTLERTIGELEKLYREGPGSTHGFGAIEDYLPTTANERFNTAANAARGIVRNALGLTGGEANTAAEAQMNLGAYIPQASNRDKTIEDSLERLRALRDLARKQATATLGGEPDANGRVTPVANAMTVPRIVDQPGIAAAGFGATTGATPIPPEYQQAYEAFVRKGDFTPDQYAAFRADLDKKYFPNAGDQSDTYRNEGARILQQLRTPGSTLNLTVPPTDKPLSGVEQVRNDIVSNPVGAAAAGFADMGSFGGVSALAGDRLNALGDKYPIAMGLGQIGGSIGGTSAIGKLGTETIGRALPSLLGGGGLARAGRTLATDTLYGGVYGGVANGDPVSGAAQAAGGSLLGQGLGTALGRTLSGVTSSPTISRLRALGVTPTIGQIARGRAADNGGRSLVAGIEDVISNNGAVGTFVNSARGRALEDANLAGYNIGTRSQGRVNAIGEQGLNQLEGIKDAAYSNALDGVSVPSGDPQFRQSLDAAGAQGAAVDAARNRGDFGYIINNQLGPALGGGETISGQQLQDGLRLLQGQSRAYRKAAAGLAPDPAAAGVSDALDSVGGAITDLAGNYSPDTLPQLRDANGIYRNLRVLDHAAEAGRNEGGVWTGAQLGNAIKANNASLGQRGFSAMSDSPFFQLQQDMQAALPNKVPPTGVNAAPMLALGGAAMGAGGVATDNDWLKAAGALALMSTPYTRAGQKAAAKVLLDRPEWLRAVGLGTRKRSGLFGAAAVPLALEAGN